MKKTSFLIFLIGILMAIDDPDVTDLEVVIDFKGHDMDGVYNLNGQQISAPCKGLNIIGRKKIVIK